MGSLQICFISHQNAFGSRFGRLVTPEVDHHHFLPYNGSHCGSQSCERSHSSLSLVFGIVCTLAAGFIKVVLLSCGVIKE